MIEMEPEPTPWLERYAATAVVVLVPICCAPILFLKYSTPAHALALVGISTALLAFISAWFQILGHVRRQRHLDLIGKQVAVAAAALGLWAAGIGYFLFDRLATTISGR